MEKKIIYLDDAATTCVCDEIISEMNYIHKLNYGNPSSPHEMGERALEIVNGAREKIAREIGAKAWEIVFTSGSTESNNLAFLGLGRTELGKKRKKIIISSIEHSSIFAICTALKKEGFEIVEIPVNKEGLINMGKLEKEIDNNTLLVSVIHANNEIGVVQDIGKIGEICRGRGIYFHTDCAQSFGKLEINADNMKIDLLSAGAHKIGGPKGIGLLYIREGVEISPLIYGGGQERGLRGGTENVAGIAGFAKALELSKKIDKGKIKDVRDYFIFGLKELGGKINGSKEKRTYNNVNVCFNGIDGERVVLALSLKGIMCSTGSACESKKKIEARVLKALGLSEKEILGSLRFSLGEDISNKEIDIVLKELKEIIESCQ